MTNKLIAEIEALPDILKDPRGSDNVDYIRREAVIALIRQHESAGVDEYKQVGFTGSGSLSSMELGGEGHIWGNSADAHPVPVYIRTATTPEQPASGMGEEASWYSVAHDLYHGLSWLYEVAKVNDSNYGAVTNAAAVMKRYEDMPIIPAAPALHTKGAV